MFPYKEMFNVTLIITKELFFKMRKKEMINENILIQNLILEKKINQKSQLINKILRKK